MSGTQQSGTRLAYAATVAFRPRPILPSQLQADLRATLDRSTAIKNAKGIQVQVEGQTAVLRGTVGDEDERRMAEGLVRLTPGVRQVRNELQVP